MILLAFLVLVLLAFLVSGCSHDGVEKIRDAREYYRMIPGSPAFIRWQQSHLF